MVIAQRSNQFKPSLMWFLTKENASYRNLICTNNLLQNLSDTRKRYFNLKAATKMPYFWHLWHLHTQSWSKIEDYAFIQYFSPYMLTKMYFKIGIINEWVFKWTLVNGIKWYATALKQRIELDSNYQLNPNYPLNAWL